MLINRGLLELVRSNGQEYLNITRDELYWLAWLWFMHKDPKEKDYKALLLKCREIAGRVQKPK